MDILGETGGDGFTENKIIKVETSVKSDKSDQGKQREEYNRVGQPAKIDGASHFASAQQKKLAVALNSKWFSNGVNG